MVAITENSVRDKIVSRFKELGLSTQEALAYIVLLTHPNVTASTLCRETNIPDSKIYYALDGLSKKECCSFSRVPRAFTDLCHLKKP